MPGVLDKLFTFAVEGSALALILICLWRKCARRHRFVVLYAVVMLLTDGLRYVAYARYGFQSYNYFYAFYLTDALLVLATYLLILSFFDVIFGDTPLHSQVRLALFFFILLVGLVSQVMIARNLSHFYSRLLVEFLQNMYFAAVILTVLLWASFNHLRISDRVLGLLIAGLGITLSAQAANYAFANLLSRDMFEALRPVLMRIPVAATLLKMGLWCYAVSGLPAPVASPAAEYHPELSLATSIEAKGSV